MSRTTILATGLLALFLSATPALATDYDIDPNHTDVGFKVKHAGVSNVRGSFTGVSGTVSYDEAHPENTTISVKIDANTVDTNVEARDNHLRGPDFFDTQLYPSLTFVSTEFKSWDAETGTLTFAGDLTMHGVTKSITMTITDITPELTSEKGGTRRAATATAAISRKEWGLTMDGMASAGEIMIGDTVNITIETELHKAEPKPVV
ncbi:MAG: YceI family protein [bacterium]